MLSVKSEATFCPGLLVWMVGVEPGNLLDQVFIGAKANSLWLHMKFRKYKHIITL